MTTEILENKITWLNNFKATWLSELERNGTVNWKLYQHPRNERAPGAPGVDLRESKLLLLTTAGAYLRGEQVPCDEPNQYGDYTLRTFPASTPFATLAYAHGHYDASMIETDAQVGIPLRHLEALVMTGELGSLAPEVVSIMGYQPDSAKVVDEIVPQVVAIAKAQDVQAALLAPV